MRAARVSEPVGARTRARVHARLATAGARAAVVSLSIALCAGCSFFSHGVSTPPPAPPVAAPPPPPDGPMELPPVGQPAATTAPTPASAPAAARDGKRGASYSPKYAAKVAQAVRANIIFPPRTWPRQRLPCEVDVSTAPDGRIVGFSVTKPSGSRDWDEAVKRGLLRTHTLPLDVDGRIPEQMVLSFKPR